MPNLGAIVTGVLNAIEDVYVRDHVGDSGDPNLWTPIDSVTIPSVPTGNQPTVSDAIVWPAA